MTDLLHSKELSGEGKHFDSGLMLEVFYEKNAAGAIYLTQISDAHLRNIVPKRPMREHDVSRGFLLKGDVSGRMLAALYVSNLFRYEPELLGQARNNLLRIRFITSYIFNRSKRTT
jgi:hypothetical protein